MWQCLLSFCLTAQEQFTNSRQIRFIIHIQLTDHGIGLKCWKESILQVQWFDLHPDDRVIITGSILWFLNGGSNEMDNYSHHAALISSISSIPVERSQIYRSCARLAQEEEDPITIGTSRQNPSGVLIFKSSDIMIPSPHLFFIIVFICQAIDV